MSRLLITGALGHIGSRFIRHLTPDDYDEILLLDNLSTQRYCSLFNLPDGVPYRFIEDDICTAELGQYFRGIDTVVHLAAITNAAGSFDMQEQVEQVNFEGTARVAQACVTHGCRLLFPSTASVYGTEKELVAEDCPPEALNPQSPYAASKLRAEQMLQSLGKTAGLRFVICRLGTIFGVSPGMRFHTAVNKFVWQACVGQPITVWRTALHQKRPYLHLEDAVRALNFILQTDRFDNEVYNVLSHNVTVNDIVKTIQTFIHDVRIEFVDSRIMNQLSYHVQNDKFTRLGFQFKGSLYSGIKEMMALFHGLRRSAVQAGLAKV